MANIQTLLAKIMSAIYGEEVRGSIHDAIEAINDEVTEWTGLQDGTVTTAKLANTAVTTAKIADGAITRAKLNADVVDTTLAVSGAPADAKTTGDKVSELKTELGELEYSVNDITVTAGTAHSASADRFSLKIKNGENCTIRGVSSDYSGNLVVRVYGFTDANDTTGTIITNSLTIPINGSVNFVSNGDYELIGLYWNTTWMVDSGVIHFRIETDDSIFSRLEDVEIVAEENRNSIESINNLVTNYIPYSKVSSDWHSGTIDPTTGENSGTSTKRLRINGYVNIADATMINVECINNILCSLFFYDISQNYIADSFSGWIANQIVNVPNNAEYIRISLKDTSDAVLSTSDVSNDLFALGIYTPLLEATEKLNDIPSYVYDTADVLQKTDISTIKTAYASLLNSVGEQTDAYMFVTDPHPYYLNDQNQIEKFYATLAKAFYQMPTQFMVSGGDWLTDGMTKAEACEALGYITAVMEHITHGAYYPLLGNHDMNIFGDGENPTLSYGAIIATMFPKQGKAYYHFNSANTSMYAIDTGSDHDAVMSEYRNDQMEWLAYSLENDNSEHIAILEHIYCVNTIGNVYTVASAVNQIITAFNARTSVTVNGDTYDYSNKTGIVEYVLAGHAHAELSGTVSGIPVIVCQRALTANMIGWDMVTVDYTNRTIKLLRTDTGAVRQFNLPTI